MSADTQSIALLTSVSGTLKRSRRPPVARRRSVPMMKKLEEGRASILREKYENQEEITMDDIIDAALKEDVLVIEVIEEIGTTLGRAVAGLINIFNPELVVIGGSMSQVKEYLMLPIKASVQKHSLNMINKDTSIKFSKLGDRAGAIGACMLSRSKLLGIF